MYELKVYFPNKDTFWLNVTEKSLDEFICYFDDEAVSGVIEIYCEKKISECSE